jgi:hypothetical protein
MMPWLTDADRPAVRRWAQLEYLAEQLYLELKNHGVFTPDREARKLLHDFRQMAVAQLSYSAALGMVPAARAAFKELPGELLDLASLRDDPQPGDGNGPGNALNGKSDAVSDHKTS